MEDEFYSDFLQRIEDFHNSEPRAFCFDLALSLINTAKAEDAENWYYHSKTIEGILLLLFCWNFASPITKKLTKPVIESLLRDCKEDLISLEQYNINNINDDIGEIILRLFGKFKNVFGQTGASKALSLLNTKLFLMWDTKIRKHLVRINIVSRIRNGENPEYYWQFLRDIKNVIERNHLTDLIENSNDIAKKIDEFHYAKIVVSIANNNQNV